LSTATFGDIREETSISRISRLSWANGKISTDVISLLDKWRDTGFNEYCGRRILPWQKRSMENLARYNIRTSFFSGATYASNNDLPRSPLADGISRIRNPEVRIRADTRTDRYFFSTEF